MTPSKTNSEIATQIMQKHKTNDPLPPYRIVPPDFADEIRKQEIIDALDSKDKVILEREGEIERLKKFQESIFRRIQYCGFGAMEWRMQLIDRLKQPETIVKALDK